MKLHSHKVLLLVTILSAIPLLSKADTALQANGIPVDAKIIKTEWMDSGIKKILGYRDTKNCIDGNEGKEGKCRVKYQVNNQITTCERVFIKPDSSDLAVLTTAKCETKELL